MKLLYLVNLAIQVLLEFESVLFSRAAQSLWWELEEGSPFMVYLKSRDSFLYSLLLRNVIPAKARFETAEIRCDELKAEKAHVSAEYETSMATLRARQPEVEQEIRGGFKAVALMTRRGYRVLEEGRQRFLFKKARTEQRLMLYVTSAGLGVLNFLALIQLMGLSFHRLTLVTLILMALGLYFSMSVMIAVHLGLLKFISATRNSTVDATQAVIHNLFPYGWKDGALWLSFLMIGGDSLFSSVGLMLSLPPSQREELFWRLAVLAISGFASLVNVLLTWGLALEGLHFDLRFKHEGAVQRQEIKALEEVISTALVTGNQMIQLKSQIKAAEIEKRTLERSAMRTYRSWFAQFRKLQREDRLLAMEGTLMEQRDSHSNFPPRLKGRTQEPTLPPFIDTDDKDKDGLNP